MCLRHLLVAGALGGMLAACGSPSEPSSETYLRGSVQDTAFRPLPGARIEIIDGPRAGASTTADGNGSFQFAGTASGAVNLRASRDGFESATMAAEWRPQTSVFWTTFLLKTPGPALTFTPGSYTLTITSDVSTATGPNCEGFPAELATRTYEGSVAASSIPMYSYEFHAQSIPSLIKRSGGLWFGVSGQFVGFQSDDPQFVEELPGFRYLMIYGFAPTDEPATSTDSSITVPFYGEFRYCQLTIGLGGFNDCSQVPAAQVIEYRRCLSTHDAMVFTKR